MRIRCVWRNWVSTVSMFTGIPARSRCSSWPTATARQHRKFHAVNDQHHLAIRNLSWKQKCSIYRKYLFLNSERSFSYLKKFRKLLTLICELNHSQFHLFPSQLLFLTWSKMGLIAWSWRLAKSVKNEKKWTCFVYVNVWYIYTFVYRLSMKLLSILLLCEQEIVLSVSSRGAEFPFKLFSGFEVTLLPQASVMYCQC